MRKYRVAWLAGDGVGKEVCDAARLVLGAAGFEADYLAGDIGWEFWRTEGDALPPRTLELLRSTDRDLAEIANQVGFSTQSHFTTVFSRRCGTTPKRYRDGARS